MGSTYQVLEAPNMATYIGSGKVGHVGRAWVGTRGTWHVTRGMEPAAMLDTGEARQHPWAATTHCHASA